MNEWKTLCRLLKKNSVVQLSDAGGEGGEAKKLWGIKRGEM